MEERRMKRRLVYILLAAIILAVGARVTTAYLGDTHLVSGSSYNKRLPDISFNQLTQCFLVVYSRWESFSEWDVVGRVLDADGIPITSEFIISDSIYSDQNPKVAYANDDTWLVVWSSTSPLLQPQIHVRRVHSNGSLDSLQAIKTNFSNPVVNPDVGSSKLNGEYLIVWEERNDSGCFEVRGKRYDPVTDISTEELTIANVPFIGIGSDFRRPSINQRGANFFVAWEKHHDSQIDIEGMQIPFSVSVQNDLPNKITVIADGGLHSEPSVAQRDDTIADVNCIVWQEEIDANNYNIRWAIYDHYINYRTGLISSTNLLEYRPCVSWAGLADHKFLVCYGKSDSWEGDWNIYGKTIDWDDGVSVEETIVSTSTIEGSPEATIAGPGQNMVTWDTDDGYGFQLYCRDWYYYAPDIVAPISAIGFGNVSVNNFLDRTTNIENSGGSPLTINTVLWSSGLTDFTYLGPTYPFAISAGSSRQVTIRFAPTSAGTKTAVFNVNSNDPNETNVNFNVSGMGVATPDIRIPILAVSFGGVNIGSSLDRTTTIYNDGTGTLTVNQITWSSGSAEFAYQVPTYPFTIAAGSSRQVTIRFAPVSAGAKSAVFNVNSNDPDEGNVTFSGNGTGTEVIVIPPTPPSGLVANVVSSSQISLSWVDNSDNENGFKVERKTGAGGAYSQIAVVGANGTSFPDSGLSPDTTYYYRVRSYNTAGDSGYSNESSATTLATVPVAPSSLTVSAISSSRIYLTWLDNATNESGFKVERKEGTGGTYSQIGAVGSDTISYSDTGLTPETDYCYRIRAYNGVGDSNYSNEICAATPVSVFSISGQVKEPNDSGIGSVNIIYGEPEALDQYQDEASPALIECASQEFPRWQEFTPSQAKLARIEYRVERRGNPGDMLVRIANSEDQTLWSVTVPQDQIPINANWISVPVEPTVVLVPETIYKIGWTTSIPSPDIQNRYFLCGHNDVYDLYTRGGTDLSTYPFFNYGFRTYSGDAAISTDSGGYYRIHVASGWSGTVTPSYSDYVFTPASRPYPSVTSDQANQDYTHIPPPVTPSDLSAGAVSSSEVNISWTDNSNNETGFRIERKIGAGGTYGQIATVGQNTTAYPDTGLSSGTTYYYRVLAYNDSGDSTYSNEASATTAIIMVPPAAPSGLVANVVSSSQISLSWVDNSDNENGFKVERKTGAGGAYSQIAVVGTNGTSFPDSGLSPDMIYYYRVRSYNTAGDSAYSNESSATTLATVPVAPSSLAASAISSSRIDLTWVDNASNESGFKVERKEGAGGTYSQIAAVGSNMMSYSDTELTTGTNYCYRVRAYNGVGDSDYSNEACVVTPVSVFTISGHVKEPNDSGIGSVDIVYGQPEVLDQFQDEAVGGFYVASQAPRWQEFTPSQAKLARIEFCLTRYGNPGAILIHINDSENQTLWSATVPQDQVPMGDANWISVPVEPTVVLVPETIYKIHLTTSIPSPDAQNRYFLCGSYIDNNNYVRGGTDTSYPFFDYGFRTYSGDAAISTDSGGSYRIDVASGWSGTVTPSYSDYVFTPASRPYPGVTSDQTSQDYTHVPPPVAPSNLSAGAVSSSEINISWADNSNNETGFRIERKTGAGGAYGQIAAVGQNTMAYPDTGLSSGTTYYYRVLAYNDSGDSTYSNEASATTAIIVVPPAGPSGLVANVVSSSQISLSWVDNSDNENGFKVERKTGAGGAYSQIAVVGTNGTSFPDSGLSPDTIYYYRVRSYNTAGDSAYSNESSATTLATVPVAPSSLAASAISSSRIDLTWVDNASNESGFKVERKEGAGGTYSQIAAVGSNMMSYSDTELTTGTNYCYRVRAYNGVGDSDYSNEACVVTPVSVFTISGHVREPNDSGIGSVDIVYGQPEVLDQFQDEAIGGFGIVPGWQRWQEFTPSQPKLARIEYSLYRRGNSGDILISITDSESQTLWSATIPQDQIPMNSNWIPVPVEPTLALVPESVYKINWTTSIPSPNPENRYYLSGCNVNNNYYTRGITDAFSAAPFFDYGFRTYSGDAAISTDSGGSYRIYVASGWSGTVTPSYSDYVFTPASRPYPGVTSDQTSQDYTHVPPPVAPSNLSAGAVSSSEINISWADNSNNETGFRIERKTGAGGAYGQIAAVGQNTMAYPDTGLSSGTTYYYRVLAYNDSGDSTYSNEASATTAIIVVPPAGPSGLVANVVSSSQISLSWVDNSDNENGFKVERKTRSGGSVFPDRGGRN